MADTVTDKLSDERLREIIENTAEALDVLKGWPQFNGVAEKLSMARELLSRRTAPAEPVAYLTETGIPVHPVQLPKPVRDAPAKHGYTPLYAAPPVAEPVAFIERAVLDQLAKHKDATGTVASGLLKRPFGDPVPLYAAPAPPSPPYGRRQMTRPEDIPERVWEEANMAVVHAPEYTDRLHEDVARTILAAEKRVTEECARLGEEGYDRPVGTPYRSDGVRSKYDQCPHNRYQYEDCERCYAAAIRKGGEHA